ncbi:tRNA synthetases class II (A)-domain-containing protein [Suillus fuscotomentosus]|uniref:tRNA synthetases class II (A)-domain-containing protein n=1 Tax=Suillus fuscotomentosus TaxID=1912939 RepID=A0AAD4EC14_9AGAM|nr:tRNA synthetases class II (A)-domain-containing protein [Suillus fuscotomentosus]KAG1903489.1 tRNA synthetases class II (A)-domain-containing protein [Suillus fuscotomentosus]
MGDAFPELTKKQGDIKEILDEEEESFSRTLDRGEKLFDQYATRTKDLGVNELNGADVWRLYDTYGFHVDLTRLMAAGNSSHHHLVYRRMQTLACSNLRLDGSLVHTLQLSRLPACTSAIEADTYYPRLRFGPPPFHPVPHNLLEFRKHTHQCNQCLRMASFQGNFFVCSTDLPAVPTNQSYAVEIQIEYTLTQPFVVM